MKRFVYLLPLLLLFSSCDKILAPRPETVFGAVGLNSNTVNGDFERIFKEIRGQGEAGRLFIYENGKTKTTKSYVTYFKSRYSDFFGEYIKKVEKLRPTDETRPMINLSLKMFKRANEVYATDLIPIAKMIDEHQPETEIDDAILTLTQTKGVELEDMRGKVLDLAVPYAKKHVIEVKYYPSFK